MDTERMACPVCGTMNVMIGVINDTRQYCCSSCGERYYTPNSCLDAPSPPGAKRDDGKRGPAADR